ELGQDPLSAPTSTHRVRHRDLLVSRVSVMKHEARRVTLVAAAADEVALELAQPRRERVPARDSILAPPLDDFGATRMLDTRVPGANGRAPALWILRRHARNPTRTV